MRDIDWKILLVLYEKRSITQTAEALFMTQSAVTKRLQAMEAEWQIQIVQRTSQGVRFTVDGQYLAQRASIMLDFLQEIGDHFSEQKAQRESLRLGIPNSFARRHMPQLLEQYMKRYNRLDIRTISNTSDVVIHHLTDGSVDIGIICGDYPYLGEKYCLYQEDLFLLVPKGTKADDISQLPIIKTHYNPIVRLLIDQWWKNQYGSLPHETYKVPYADIAIEMVESGLGLAFLFGTNWAFHPEKAQQIPVYDRQDQPVMRKVWMMLSERCARSPEIMEFVELVKEQYHVL